ncbi:MAG: hypothetical protein AB2A00_17690 [Myxococcota bacterium]
MCELPGTGGPFRVMATLALLLGGKVAARAQEVPLEPPGAAAPAPTATPLAPPASEAPAPAVQEARSDAAQLDLGSMLGQDIRGGDVGSFGLRLAEYGVTVELHGYLTVELEGTWPTPEQVYKSQQGSVAWSERHKQLPVALGFDLQHTTAVIRSNIHDRVYPEFALEMEHAGAEIYVPWAFLDLRVTDWFVLRAGYVPVAIGAFNEYLYPDFLRKTAASPLMHRDLIPSIWSEVGVQARGKFDLGGQRNVNYAVYVVNGLEQADRDPHDGVVPEGGAIRGMRRNFRDLSHPDKAVGGRLGVGLARGVDVGASAYTGAYTVDGRRRLTLLDTDLTVAVDEVTFRWEAAVGHQELGGTPELGLLPRARLHAGTYALGAYRVLKTMEPYCQLDVLTTVDSTSVVTDQQLRDAASGTRGRFLVGAAFYPLRREVPSVIIKTEGGVQVDGRGALDISSTVQLAAGF